jgi:S-formylglutathione hydrolase
MRFVPLSLGANTLVYQGSDDKFLKEQLKPEAFEAAAKGTSHKVQARMQEGYDHR